MRSVVEIFHCRLGHKKRQRGLASVELAVVALLLLLLLLVAADFGRVFSVSIRVANAARVGAEYGVRNHAAWEDLAGMRQAALNDGKEVSGLSAVATNFCECPPTGVLITCGSPACLDPKTYVRVTTTATFKTITKYPTIPDSISLSRSAVIRAN